MHRKSSRSLVVAARLPEIVERVAAAWEQDIVHLDISETGHWHSGISSSA
jgi:hypothetical protein